MTAPGYLDVILDICHKEHISGVLSLIDPELSLLAKHAEEFNSLGALAVSKTSAKKTTTTSAINNTTVTVTNTNPQISSIDLSSGILHNTEYLKSGILAKKSGIFYNNLSGIVSLDSGTIGMIAVGDGSSVINNG